MSPGSLSSGNADPGEPAPSPYRESQAAGSPSAMHCGIADDVSRNSSLLHLLMELLHLELMSSFTLVPCNECSGHLSYSDQAEDNANAHLHINDVVMLMNACAVPSVHLAFELMFLLCWRLTISPPLNQFLMAFTCVMCGICHTSLLLGHASLVSVFD